MTHKSDGKAALITGLGRGIGRQATLKLADERARIVVNDLDAEPAQEAVQGQPRGGQSRRGLRGQRYGTEICRALHQHRRQRTQRHGHHRQHAGYTWGNVTRRFPTGECTQQREAFWQAVFDFRNTRFKLAECATVAHVVRAFVNDCIQRLLDATLDDEATYTEQQGKVTTECLRLFAGYGYMSEYPIARLYADARIRRIYGSTTEILKDLSARRLSA